MCCNCFYKCICCSWEVPKRVAIAFTNASVACGKCLNVLQLLLQMHLLLRGKCLNMFPLLLQTYVDCGKCLNMLQLLLQIHLLPVGLWEMLEALVMFKHDY